MSDFSELCPIFNTGVYHELYLGRWTASVYTSATYNFLSSVGDPATAPASMNFGRTVVVTKAWLRRIGAVTTATCSYRLGRRTGSGTATQSIFGLLTISEDQTTHPDFAGNWQLISLTACMTVNTADFLDLSCTGVATDASFDVIVQYREK